VTLSVSLSDTHIVRISSAHALLWRPVSEAEPDEVAKGDEARLFEAPQELEQVSSMSLRTKDKEARARNKRKQVSNAKLLADHQRIRE